MNEKQPSTHIEWHSLQKDEQETLKKFFVLLHRIDCRLKGKGKRYQNNEDHKNRNCSNQT
jgi:hypothetical protein